MFSTTGASMVSGQLCLMGKLLSMFHGHLVTVTTLHCQESYRPELQLFSSASSAQVMSRVSLSSQHPWSIYPWPAFFLDPKAAEGKWGHWFVARSISKVARDAVSGATVPGTSPVLC